MNGKTRLARTELIMIWKASLSSILLLLLDHRIRCVLLIKLCFDGCLLVLCRGAALVEVFVEVEGQTAFSRDHQAWLEVWTDDGSLPVSAHHYQQPVATDGHILGQMSLAVQEYSPVKSGKDCHGRDLIIGKPGMLKLGLGIDAKTGHLCNVKRRMRK